jgi:hypothetical protein
MNCKTWMGIAAGTVLMLLGAGAQAQKMHRCGNVYQDRPCDTAQPGTEVRNFDNAPRPVASAGTDTQCRQRGIDSQKIVWSREGGALAEKLRAAAYSEDEKTLITEVYGKRGTAPEVRASIEADCIAAKKHAQEVTAALAATGKQPGSPAPGVAPARPQAPESRAVEAGQGGDASALRSAESQKRRCNSINTKIEGIQNSQRSGGSVAAMESLNQRRRDAEAERDRAGC